MRPANLDITQANVLTMSGLWSPLRFRLMRLALLYERMGVEEQINAQVSIANMCDGILQGAYTEACIHIMRHLASRQSNQCSRHEQARQVYQNKHHETPEYQLAHRKGSLKSLVNPSAGRLRCWLITIRTTGSDWEPSTES